MKGLSSDSKLKGWILRLRGLPFNATDEDVVRSFPARPEAGGLLCAHLLHYKLKQLAPAQAAQSSSGACGDWRERV